MFREAFENKSKIDALKKMLEKWEKMFHDSFDKWKEAKEKLELINDSLLKQSQLNALK